MGRLSILDIQPGYLNDFNVDDVDMESIDFASETPQSIINRMKDKVFSPNKFKTSGTLIGVLLRADNKYTSDCTAQDSAISVVATGNRGVRPQKYGLNTYKVYVPELHFMLKKPNNLNAKTQSNADKLAIDAFPDMQAIDTLVQRQGALPGDLVKVELANKGAITRMYFAGPLDPKDTGYNKQQLKDCIDACRKMYTGQGASGDCVGKNKKVNKLDDAIPLATDEGHSDNKLIDDGAAKWLPTLVDPKKNTNFKGIVWIGKLEGNGPKDDLKFIDATGTGRNTLIYVPKGVNLNTGLEIIYFFHNAGKFANDSTEWNKIGKTITEMTKKNPQYDNARRNVIFVMPEMPWSKQKMSGKSIKPRADLKKSELTKYGDRQWPVWGWGGTNTWDRVPWFLTHKIPGGTDIFGSIDKFTAEIEKVLVDKFGINKKRIEQTTLVGDRHGAIAISNLARMKKLGNKQFRNLKSIKLWNGDYSSTAENSHHDNDIKDIALAIDPNKVEIEYHLSKDAPDLPKRALGAWIGRTSWMTLDWITNPTSDKDPLKAAQAELRSFYGQALKYRKLSVPGVPQGPMNSPWFEKLNPELKQGEKFIQANRAKTLRLSGRWVNFIFRGVDGSLNFDWIKWWEEPNAPTAIAASEVIKTPGKIIKSQDSSSNITVADESFFKKFKGSVLLYNSTQTKAYQGKTAIVVPRGVNLKKPYELIYFFHGIKANLSQHMWRGSGFKKKIQNKLIDMVNKDGRNIIYVTTQLNLVKDMKYEDATFGAQDSSFESFHTEVVGKIKETDPAKGLGATADPKFINIKAHSGGYLSLAGLVNKLTSNIIGGTKLQRIDYLNASHKVGIDVVFKKVYVDNKAAFNPGKDLEIHIYTPKDTEENTVTIPKIKRFLTQSPCNPKGDGGNSFNGCANVPADKQGDPKDGLTGLEGLYMNLKSAGNDTTIAYKKINTPSLLDPNKGKVDGVPITKKKLSPVSPAKIPVSYDEEGNAYNQSGEQLSDKHKLDKPNVKCKKGNKKRQRAKTTKPRALKACEKECRDEAKGKKKKNKKGTKGGEVECGPNPLGLLNMKAHVKGFSFTCVQQQVGGYYWGNKKVADWINNVLEHPIWAQSGLTQPPNSGQYATITRSGNPQKGKKGIQWLIGDLSPKWANGIDMVRSHVSHREGVDLDMSMPMWYKYSRPNRRLTGPGTDSPSFKQMFESPDAAAKYNGIVVDYDKTIVLALLTIEHSPGTIILWGESPKNKRGKPGSFFKKFLKRRIKELQTGKYGQLTGWMGKPDKAFKDLFAKLADEGEGGPLGKKVFNMFRTEKNHENHFHVRVGGRTLIRKGFKGALARLEKKGCEYPGPHKKSRKSWREWVVAGQANGTYNLSVTKPPKAQKPQPGSK